MHFIWPHRKALKDVRKNYISMLLHAPSKLLLFPEVFCKTFAPTHKITAFAFALSHKIFAFSHIVCCSPNMLCILSQYIVLSSETIEFPQQTLCSHTKALKYSFIACPFTSYYFYHKRVLSACKVSQGNPKVLQANAKVLWVNMFLRECKSIDIYFFLCPLSLYFF